MTHSILIGLSGDSDFLFKFLMKIQCVCCYFWIGSLYFGKLVIVSGCSHSCFYGPNVVFCSFFFGSVQGQ